MERDEAGLGARARGVFLGRCFAEGAGGVAESRRERAVQQVRGAACRRLGRGWLGETAGQELGRA